MESQSWEPVGGCEWLVTAAAVRGAAHVRTGMPCQDRVMWKADPSAVAVAVADGHGSARCPLSHVGAQFAVDVAVHRLFDMRACSLEDIERERLERLPRLLVGDWKAKVDGHREGTESEPIAYGTTLLAALATREYVLALQLGDGDIVRLRGCDTAERLVERDPRLIGNETTSLCDPDAAQSTRSVVVSVDDTSLVMMATDGYANSFLTDEDFLATAPDYLERVSSSVGDKAGRKAVRFGLPLGAWFDSARRFLQIGRKQEEWQKTASERGSGDDITVALILRVADLGEARDRDEEGMSEPVTHAEDTWEI